MPYRPRIMELKLDVPPDITYQYPDLMSVVRASVKASGIPLKVLADKLGERDENALSRKLSANGADNVNFPLKKLSLLIAALGEEGKPILYWLNATHLVEPEQKAEQAAKTLQGMMPTLIQLVRDVGYRVEKAP
ncbi:hypothetical protein SAMN02949497_1256 [Methylomagnum ishizawai]|uniref:Uncharacterized protein n=1 Tax=Methylomagnum ishizawai TaxID=1760988 RepID=A0A1Y6CUT2_9GAMM|nr:hypothetical protein [Methylomagnum ishizawai]SMF93960.1 hypothetical protein SAMN02949497_1256 [Methylomagnum ishizawai]